MHTYYTRNNSCAGSNIRIGSWSVSTYCVDNRDSASQVMRGNSHLLFV